MLGNPQVEHQAATQAWLCDCALFRLHLPCVHVRYARQNSAALLERAQERAQQLAAQPDKVYPVQYRPMGTQNTMWYGAGSCLVKYVPPAASCTKQGHFYCGCPQGQHGTCNHKRAVRRHLQSLTAAAADADDEGGDAAEEELLDSAAIDALSEDAALLEHGYSLPPDAETLAQMAATAAVGLPDVLQPPLPSDDQHCSCEARTAYSSAGYFRVASVDVYLQHPRGQLQLEVCWLQAPCGKPGCTIAYSPKQDALLAISSKTYVAVW